MAGLEGDFSVRVDVGAGFQDPVRTFEVECDLKAPEPWTVDVVGVGGIESDGIYEYEVGAGETQGIEFKLTNPEIETVDHTAKYVVMQLRELVLKDDIQGWTAEALRGLPSIRIVQDTNLNTGDAESAITVDLPAGVYVSFLDIQDSAGNTAPAEVNIIYIKEQVEDMGVNEPDMGSDMGNEDPDMAITSPDMSSGEKPVKPVEQNEDDGCMVVPNKTPNTPKGLITLIGLMALGVLTRRGKYKTPSNK